MDCDLNGDSMEKLKGLQISSLDDEDFGEVEEKCIVDEEYDDDENDEEEQEMMLGFVEKPKNKWSLLRQLFPSKAGGGPAWLDPDNLPSGTSCLCDMCGEPMRFLLQVYAPISEIESAFHRTLFVFMCPSMACLLRDQHEQWKRPPEKGCRSVKVFRSQLSRYNSFYSSEPPKHNGTDKPSGSGAALCTWCDCWKGDKFCGSCRTARYCSQKHQSKHWQSGHKFDCSQMSLSSQSSNSSPNNIATTASERRKVSSNTMWPEYEIINEEESEFDSDAPEDNGCANSLVIRKGIDESTKALFELFEGDDDKKSWASFQERIAKAPEQVLRYSRSARPLWPMANGRPSKVDIPKCSYCGGPRSCEFQVLPQLLYYFGVKNDVDSLDWATIVVYTCEASCEASVAYREEFAWVQLLLPSTTLA